LTKVPPDTGGFKIISRETGVPAVDLSSLTMPLSILDVLPEEAAKTLQILPLRVEGDRLFIATVHPEEGRQLDELAFLTGRQVVAYAAHPEQLRATIEAVYQARDRGQLVWHGARAQRFGPSHAAPSPLEDAIRNEPMSTPLPVREPFAPGTESVSYVAPAPTTLPGAPAPTPTVGPRTVRTRSCILVVDDEPVIRRLVNDALAQRGYEVLQAAGGVECLRFVKQHEPDAIVLDAMLPDVHGFDICKRMRASRRYQHIPIIMITALYKGWRMAQDLRDSYGVYATLEKPFDMHDLVRILEEALAGRSPSERPEVLSAEAQRLYKDSAAAYKRGDLDGAAAALRQALAGDPLSPTLHHQLGLLYAQRGQDFAAIQELEAAVDLDPSRFQTLRNLAVLFQKHGFRRRACEIWERALAHAPDDATRAEVRTILLKIL
jgi:DNA-binding response OmpR family regulator